jgi:FHA domain-containing protein
MSNQMLKPPYYIELLTRDKHLKTRHRFEQLPIRIGRAYDNDLVLDDPYIAPNHAIIEMAESGSIQIRDLDSENGVVSQGKRHPVIQIDDHIIRLGHTNMRVRHAGVEVNKALTDKASHGWEGWPPAIAGLLMIILSTLVSVWLGTSEKFSMLSAIATISLILMMVIIWSGGWALATRVISGGSSRFGRHIFIVACAAILVDCWDFISVTFAYAFSLEFLTLYGSHIAIAIAAGMVFFHLMTINSQHPRRFMVTCVILALLGSSFTLITNYQRSGQLADGLYMTHLLPPALRLSDNASVEAFIDNAKDLKPKLDKAREKPANLNQGLFGR